jgi:hypothetical protein
MEPFPPQIRPRNAQTRQNRTPPAKTWRQKGAAAGRGTCGAGRWVKRGSFPAYLPNDGAPRRGCHRHVGHPPSQDHDGWGSPVPVAPLAASTAWSRQCGGRAHAAAAGSRSVGGHRREGDGARGAREAKRKAPTPTVQAASPPRLTGACCLCLYDLFFSIRGGTGRVEYMLDTVGRSLFLLGKYVLHVVLFSSVLMQQPSNWL